MAGEMDSFLATVDEFFDDEERIVTCKWLSQQLAIPVTKSREILQTYANSCENQNKPIEIVRTLSGRSQDGFVFSIVKDSELEEAKAKLDEIHGTSLYSIQKGKLLNNSVLYAADFETTRNNFEELVKFGGIEYRGAKKLSKEDIKKRRITPGGDKDVSSERDKQFAKPQNSSKPKINFFGKTSKDTEISSKSKSGNENSSKSTILQPEPKNVAQKKSQKGVAGFLTKVKTDPFAPNLSKIKEIKKEIKKEIPEKPKTSPKIDHPDPKPVPIQQNVTKNKQKSNGHKPKILEDELKIDDFSDDEDIFKIEDPKPEKNHKKKPKKTEKTTKKRKRIEWLSSSSEDEEDEETEIVDILPPSPPRKKILESPEKDISTNKRMKKVLKTKTFIDEEGCMVTEKSYELEECDEAEPVSTGDKIAKSNDTISIKTKKIPSVSTAAQPKKQKQASIMGFFKKK